MWWFAGAVLLLLAALFIESGLLAYAMYVLLGLLLLSRWLARSWVDNLTAERSVRPAGKREDDQEEATADGLTLEIGQRVIVRVVVRNDGTLPVPWVLLEDTLPKNALNPLQPQLKIMGKRLQIGMLKGGGELVLKYSLECLVRGYHQIGPLV